MEYTQHEPYMFQNKSKRYPRKFRKDHRCNQKPEVNTVAKNKKDKETNNLIEILSLNFIGKINWPWCKK